MNAMEIGQDLVALCNAGNEQSVMDKYYDNQIVSIEGPGGDEAMARLKGLDAVKQKSAWWYDNHTVHALKASGPYVGSNPDQFVVRFELDVTPKDGDRMQMDEVGVYKVSNDKIVEEAFLYNMGPAA